MIRHDTDIASALRHRRRQQELIKGQGADISAFSLPSYVGGPRARDPYWDYVVCDLPFHGSNGSTAIADTMGNTWSATNASISNAVASPWDSTALLTAASGTTYIRSPANNSRFDFGAGDFGIQVWVHYTSVPGAGGVATIGGVRNSAGGTPYSWGWYHQNTAGAHSLVFFYSTTGTSSISLTAPMAAPTGGTWYHYFCGCKDGDFRQFVGGMQIGPTAAISGTLFFNSSIVTTIGQLDSVNNSGAWRGRFKHVRMWKGVCPWTANFTPPNPPLPIN